MSTPTSSTSTCRPKPPGRTKPESGSPKKRRSAWSARREYAAYIINALEGGETFTFNGNVPNTKLIPNLPESACVEVPVYADRNGFRAVHVGNLPPQCVTLTHTSVMVEEMAVEAALTGDPRLLFQAIAHDPLSAAVLSLAEIKTMVNEMLQQNQAYLPQYRHFSI